MVDPSLLDEEGRFKFVPQEVAARVTSKHRFATHRRSHTIWVYKNGVYSSDGEETIRAEVRELLGDQAKEWKVNEVVAHIKETTYTDPERFDPPINLVNVKNGILNVQTLEIAQHSPDTIFINELPVEYDANVECPAIMKFLSEILAPDDIPLAQEIVGYCLLRAYPLARASMFLGEGENGKSTLLNLIIALLGRTNVATPSLQDIVHNRFAQAELFGKLANVHADIPTTKLSSTGRFKMLTGQDLMYADQKHRQPFTFENYAKLIYSANELPQTTDMSEAFWRRWILIKFPNRFPEGDPETDPSILDKLTNPSELSGFLNWALEGLKRLLTNNRFSTSRTADGTKREWMLQTDSLRAFVIEHAIYDPTCLVTKADLYTAYSDFAEEHEVPIVDKSVVGRQLPMLIPKITERKVGERGYQHRAWVGIRLSNPYGKYNLQTGIQDIKTYYTINNKKSDEKIIIKDLDTRLSHTPKWLAHPGHDVHPIPISKIQKNIDRVDARMEPLDQEKPRHDGHPGHESTVSDLQTRLFDVFGVLPFKPSQLRGHFTDEELPRLAEVMADMERRGELMRMPLEGGGHAWELVRK